MMLLDINSVTKRYKRGGVSFNAVDSVSLKLQAGEFVCITGASGSGKSTLLAIAAGLLRADAGSVTFNGVNCYKLSDSRLSALRNNNIGYIPQGHCLLDNLSVADNVCLPFTLKKRSGDPYKSAMQLLDRVGITALSSSYPAELSGGEQRRAAIARGLINNPELLIADEPTGDLDPDNADNILALFSEIARSGTAVLIVTHERAEPAGCTRHLKMNAGKLNSSLASPDAASTV